MPLKIPTRIAKLVPRAPATTATRAASSIQGDISTSLLEEFVGRIGSGPKGPRLGAWTHGFAGGTLGGKAGSPDPGHLHRLGGEERLARLGLVVTLLSTAIGVAAPAPPPLASPVPLPAPRLGEAGHAEAELPRVHALQPMRSLAELADWFAGRGRLDRALEIVAFALAHDPRETGMVRRAAQLYQRLGVPASARAYARRLLDLAPGDPVAEAILATGGTSAPGTPGATSTSPGATGPAAGSPARPGPGPGSSTPGATPAKPAPEAGKPIPLDEKLRTLSLMKLVRSAVIGYNLRHPRKPMESLDLAKLRGDGLLPADFSPPGLDLLGWEGGEPKLVGVGTLGELESAVGGYHRELAAAEDWMARGQPREALRDLQKMEGKYGRTDRILALGQRALRAIDPEKAAEAAWAEEVGEPARALQRGLELWRDGRSDRAETALSDLLARWPASAEARVAGRLLGLVRAGHSLEGLQYFYEARRRALAASRSTTASAATSDGAGADAESP